jgi:hypothetical protein
VSTWSRVPHADFERHLRQERERRPSQLTVRRLARQMELAGVDVTARPVGLYERLREIGWWAVDLNNLVLNELRSRAGLPPFEVDPPREPLPALRPRRRRGFPVPTRIVP